MPGRISRAWQSRATGRKLVVDTIDLVFLEQARCPINFGKWSETTSSYYLGVMGSRSQIAVVVCSVKIYEVLDDSRCTARELEFQYDAF